MIMNKIKVMAVGLGLATVLIAGAACANGAAPASPPESSSPASIAPASPSQSGTVPISSTAPLQTGATNASMMPSSSPAAMSAFMYAGPNSQSGIWVTGEAIVKAEPDLAILNVGVETTARTVAEANGKAATAMDAIIKKLEERGIEGRDVKTTSFNIWPQYEYGEVIEDGRRVSKQELVGYRVSNSASINVRDLDAIGDIIDEVATAGGDATRINGINFTIEDPKPFMNDLRDAAVKDAIAKAEQFASLTDVTLGRLVFISETGGSAPVVYSDYDMSRGIMMEAAMAAPSTPIGTGELQFRLGVQAVFEIL